MYNVTIFINKLFTEYLIIEYIPSQKSNIMNIQRCVSGIIAIPPCQRCSFTYLSKHIFKISIHLEINSVHVMLKVFIKICFLTYFKCKMKCYHKDLMINNFRHIQFIVSSYITANISYSVA